MYCLVGNICEQKQDYTNQVNMRKLCILGSTGSIGLSTLDVIRLHPEKFNVVSLSAHESVEQLIQQCREFHPQTVVMSSEKHAQLLSSRLKEEGLSGIQVNSGKDALCKLAASKDTDTVMAAIVGSAGLLPTLAAVQAGKRVLISQ